MSALSNITNQITSTISNLTMSIPKTCRAAVIEEAGKDLVVKEVPVPEPKNGEVLIKTEACGVCHSDFGVQQGHFGPMVQYPRIPGHEVIGKVVAVGSGVSQYKVGDRLGGPWHGGHDGTCKLCNKAAFQMCDNRVVNGVTKDGGYSEYCILRQEAAVPIPSDMDVAEVAPLLCAGVTVFNSIKKMNVDAGDIVAVQGLGGLGHLAIQYARKMGYRTVAISRNDKKKDFAMKLGATDYIDTSKGDAAEQLKKMGGAALVVITAPNPDVVGQMIGGCAPMGKVLMLAPVGEVKVNTVPMITEGISVHGWPSGHALNCEEAIEFADVQGVKCMIEKFKLDDVNDALKHCTEGNVRFRAVLVF